MKTKKVINMIKAAVFLALLVFISESIYIYKNETFLVAKYSAKVSNYYFQKDDLSNTLKFLNFGSNMYLRKNRKFFPEMNQNFKNESKFPQLKEQTRDEVKKVLKNKTPLLLENSFPEVYSNTYYHLGLTLYNSDFKSESINFLENSVNLTPAISFLYVELANAYAGMGKHDEAINVLNACEKIKETADFCTNYKKDYALKGTFTSLGELQNITDKYQLGKFTNM